MATADVMMGNTRLLQSSNVFCRVIGTLSSMLLDAIPGDKSLFLTENCQGVLLYHSLDTNEYNLSGSLDDINRCRDKFVSLLKLPGSDQDPYGIKTPIADSFGKPCTRDVSVTCDILTELESDTDNTQRHDESKAKVDDASRVTDNVNDINGEDTQSKEEVREIDEGFEVEKQNAILLSKCGRTIRRPSKYESSVVLSVKSEDGVESEEVIGGDAGSLRKTHGRRGGYTRKPMKRRGMKRNLQKVPIEDIKRQVEEEKARQMKEKGMGIENVTDFVSDSDKLEEALMNEMMKVQSQLEKEEIENKRSIKRHYEDRMPLKYSCSYCSYKSKRESHLKKHVQLHQENPDMKLYKCDECDFTTMRQGVLFRHRMMHETLTLNCSQCKYKTTNPKEFSIHVKTHERKQVKVMPQLRCSQCNFQTLSETRLMKHVELHGLENEGVAREIMYHCRDCQYRTRRKGHLERHSKIHSNMRPYLCDLCGAAFKRIDALAAHKVTHVDRSKRKLPFPCSQCKKAFKSRAHLKEHMYVHTSVRSHQCHICGQLFKTRAAQYKHQQSIHAKPRSYQCTSCNKFFNTKHALQRHMRTHEEDMIENQGHTRVILLDPSLCKRSDQQDQARVIYLDQTRGNKTNINEKGEELQPEMMDENMRAIQTITISSENIGDFSNQLQSVSDQLQTGSDVGEVYIQGLEGIETDTVNIVNLGDHEVRQIFIPSAAGDECVTQGSDPNSEVNKSVQNVTSKPAFQFKEVLVSSSVSDADYVRHILIPSGSALTPDENRLKELHIQFDTDSQPVRHILIPSSGTTNMIDSTELVTLEKKSNIIDQITGQDEDREGSAVQDSANEKLTLPLNTVQNIQ